MEDKEILLYCYFLHSVNNFNNPSNNCSNDMVFWNTLFKKKKQGIIMRVHAIIYFTVNMQWFRCRLKIIDVYLYKTMIVPICGELFSLCPVFTTLYPYHNDIFQCIGIYTRNVIFSLVNA